jgi:esterase/lipase superfamily enzyme
MQIEYKKWWSPNVGLDMELKIYGWYGKPVLVFPAQGGRFFEYEDFKMVEAISSAIEAGKIKLFTVDSLDNQSWGNASLHPADRARRHEDYDRYITGEVVPFIHHHCAGTSEKFMTTGCSMGAYHAANFFFRHPDVFDAVIALSGLYQLKPFVGSYMDDTIFFNSPLDYLAAMNDPWYLDQYRQSKIIACCGRGAWEDAHLADLLALSQILNEKSIPAWIDIWGQDVDHDWPWWRRMMPYFLSRIGY